MSSLSDSVLVVAGMFLLLLAVLNKKVESNVTAASDETLELYCRLANGLDFVRQSQGPSL